MLCIWVFYLHLWLYTTFMLGAKEARRGCQIPWDRSYRPLLATMWVLGIEPILCNILATVPCSLCRPSQRVFEFFLKRQIWLEAWTNSLGGQGRKSASLTPVCASQRSCIKRKRGIGERWKLASVARLRSTSRVQHLWRQDEGQDGQDAFETEGKEMGMASMHAWNPSTGEASLGCRIWPCLKTNKPEQKH